MVGLAADARFGGCVRARVVRGVLGGGELGGGNLGERAVAHARREARPARGALARVRALLGWGLTRSRRGGVEVARRRPRVGAGVWLHPAKAPKVVAGQGGAWLGGGFADMEALAPHPRVRVIGETGLDHYWVPADDTEGRAVRVDSVLGSSSTSGVAFSDVAL